MAPGEGQQERKQKRCWCGWRRWSKSLVENALPKPGLDPNMPWLERAGKPAEKAWVHVSLWELVLQQDAPCSGLSGPKFPLLPAAPTVDSALSHGVRTAPHQGA